MKLANRIFAIIAIIFSIVSCDVATKVESNSFVISYFGISGIHLSSHGNMIWIAPVLDYGKNCSILSNGYERQRFDSLCRKHNDLGCKQTISYFGSLPDDGYSDADFIKLDITCDKPFDADHMAGTALAGLFRFVAFSPYSYIKSRYKQKYDYAQATLSNDFMTYYRNYFNSILISSPYYPVDKMADSLTSDDLTLVRGSDSSTIGILCFQKSPNTSGTYDFTVTMTTDDGQSFSDDIAIVF